MINQNLTQPNDFLIDLESRQLINDAIEGDTFDIANKVNNILNRPEFAADRNLMSYLLSALSIRGFFIPFDATRKIMISDTGLSFTRIGSMNEILFTPLVSPDQTPIPHSFENLVDSLVEFLQQGFRIQLEISEH